MLNKILDELKNMEESYEEVKYEEKNEMGFIIRRNSDILAQCGFSIACMSIGKFDENYVPVIIVDYDFMDISDNAKQFMIYHELGHFELQRDKMINEWDGTRDITMEYEADEYAMNKIGLSNAIYAINELIEVVNEISFGINTEGIKELENRLDNILNKSIIME